MEFKRFLDRFILILLLLIIGVAWLVWSPRKLSQYDGKELPPLTHQEASQYLSHVKKNLASGNIVRLKEKGVNQFLNSRLESSHSYALNPWVEVQGVFINVTPEQLSLCLEQEIYGRPHQIEITQSLNATQVSTSRIRSSLSYTSGMIGKLKLPVRVVYPLSPWIEEFQSALSPVLQELKPFVGQIQLSEGEIILYPSGKS